MTVFLFLGEQVHVICNMGSLLHLFIHKRVLGLTKRLLL